ncbi:MAG: AAA family ATPase [Desulfovibrio sp.]|uniref:AAA family ATPase n=1 Tax=Desulfovibrio sp. TaxID=885 RepID=UPI001A7184D0|nr:AAA family ATPase [Desulfovibrio sp.]MBD5416531.1 AAA family ATPase [Desulfovibrio sp.]
MYTSRNDLFKKFFGEKNCGQYILNDREQFFVYRQIITHLLNIDSRISSIPTGIIKPFEQEPASIYSLNMYPNKQYATDDPILNLSRKSRKPIDIVTQEIGEKYFSLHKKDLFGYEYPENPNTFGYDRESSFLELNQNTRLKNLPNLFSLNDEQFIYEFVLQYSACDGDFQSGEAFYFSADGNHYFPINICFVAPDNGMPKFIKEIMPGYKYDTSLLLNSNLITTYDHKKVIVFFDKIVAHKLISLINTLPFVPSTYNFYTSSPKFDISYLKYRDVIIVPLPQIESYLNALELGKLLDINGSNVFISIRTIYPFDKITISPSIFNKELFIKNVVEQSISLKEIDWPKFLGESEFLFRPRQYENWLIQMNIINNKIESNICNIHISSITDFTNFVPHDYCNIILDNILSPKTTTFCYGESTSGKSIWCLSLALALVSGMDIFDFSVVTKKKVLYIDYETNPDIFISNIDKLIQAYGLDKALINDNFKFSLKKLDPNVSYIWNGQQSTQFFDSLKNTIKQQGINIIIIDTLTKAAPKCINSPSSAISFMDFIDKASTELNTSFLIIHHSNIDGDMDGSSVFLKNATNVFKVMKDKRPQIYEGVNLKISYPKVKMAPQLDCTESSFFLRLAKTPDEFYRWERNVKDSNIINISGDSIVEESIPWDTNLYNTNENDILCTLYKNNDAMSLKEIISKSKFSQSNTSLRKMIKKINKKSKRLQINLKGSGPSSKYKLDISNGG